MRALTRSHRDAEQQFKVKCALGELQDLKNIGDPVTLLAQKSQ